MFKPVHYVVIGLSLLAGLPSIASEEANFKSLTLAKGFNQASAFVTGSTSGSFSLTNLAKVDSQNRPCIGYGAVNPDHILVLKNDFSNLSLAVDSGGQNTTLVIRDTKTKTMHCALGSSANKDAQLKGENWNSGEYEVWVGSVEAGKRLDYRLVAKSAN